MRRAAGQVKLLARAEDRRRILNVRPRQGWREGFESTVRRCCQVVRRSKSSAGLSRAGADTQHTSADTRLSGQPKVAQAPG